MPSPYVNIPLPPVLGPFPTPSAPVAPPGRLYWVFYQWNPEKNIWGTSAIIEGQWDAYALGYYHSPIDWTGLPTVTVVLARTFPDGSIAPNVLTPSTWSNGVHTPNPTYGIPPAPSLPPPPLTPSPLCAAGEVFIPWPAIDGSNWPPLNVSTIDNPPDGVCVPLLVFIPMFPTCPPGTMFDLVTETCKPVGKLPPPVCPPGTQWDPITETCKPVKKPPPPVCPPGTQWDPFTETCKPIFKPPPPGQPCIPIPSQWDDELTAGLNCVSENLIVIQQLLQQQQQGGEPPQLDPVTCTQLSYLVGTLDTTLIAIARAIQTATGNPPTPIDLTPITTALMLIARDLQELIGLESDVWNRPVTVKPLPPDQTAQINQVIHDALAGIPSTSGAAQLLTS